MKKKFTVSNINNTDIKTTFKTVLKRNGLLKQKDKQSNVDNYKKNNIHKITTTKR